MPKCSTWSKIMLLDSKKTDKHLGMTTGAVIHGAVDCKIPALRTGCRRWFEPWRIHTLAKKKYKKKGDKYE